MNSHWLRPLLIIVCWLFGWLPSKEQAVTNGYSITHYNSDNALPQNSITGMAFDKNGFLWLTTQMGIVRFDGKNFREYNRQNSPAVCWNEFSLLQPAPGTNRVYFTPTADSSRTLTVTDDYQIVADSVIAAYPPQQLMTRDSHTGFWDGTHTLLICKDTVLQLQMVNNKPAYKT